MLHSEVLIAPFLESRLELRIVAIASLFDHAVEMRCVLRVGVVGREVGSSTEPRGIALFQVSKIRMDGGNHRTARMKHERNTRRKKRRAGATRNFGGEFFGK